MNQVDYQKYKSIINNLKIPEGTPDDESTRAFEPLTAWLNANNPKWLYRFSRCSERNFDAFYNSKLQFSKANAFNDPYDALVYMDENAIKEALIRDFRDELPVHVVKMLKNSFRGKEMSGGEDILSIQILLERAKSQLRNDYFISCLTTEINSMTMWAHYSESHSGFAIGYEDLFGRVMDSRAASLYLNMLPVVYSSKRYDATDFGEWICKQYYIRKYNLNTLNLDRDLCSYVKAVLFKSNDWEYEKEWRILKLDDSQNLEKNNHYQLVVNPNAVYLGVNISAINKKILLDIAREKQIPAFQMKLRKNRATYTLEKISV